MTSGKRKGNPSLRINGKLMTAGGGWPNRVNDQIQGYPLNMAQCYQELKMDKQTSILTSCHWHKYAETVLTQVTHINPSIKFGDAMGTLALRIIQANSLMETKGMDLAKRLLLNSIR